MHFLETDQKVKSNPKFATTKTYDLDLRNDNLNFNFDFTQTNFKLIEQTYLTADASLNCSLPPRTTQRCLVMLT